MSDQVPNKNSNMRGNVNNFQVRNGNEFSQIDNMRMEVAQMLQGLKNEVRGNLGRRRGDIEGLRDAVDDIRERVEKLEERQSRLGGLDGERREGNTVTLKVFLISRGEYIGEVEVDEKMKVKELEEEIHGRYGDLRRGRIYYIYSGTDGRRVLYDSNKDDESFYLEEIEIKDGDLVYIRL